MLIAIPDLLDAATLADLRATIDAAEWIDGNATSGHQSALAKQNEQLPEDSAAAKAAGKVILDALGRSPLFFCGGIAAQGLPAAVQPLWRRPDLWRAC